MSSANKSWQNGEISIVCGAIQKDAMYVKQSLIMLYRTVYYKMRCDPNESVVTVNDLGVMVVSVL